jgi:pilus assembly protein FimV
LGAALVSVAALSAAHAAGLGKLTVLSGLGQPLHAEIELSSVSREEANSVSVRLASAEAFRQANIDFNPALHTLRFAIEQRGNRQIVRITSAQPMNEPFVDMLLEVGGSGSRLVREYTFLLDPPELRKPQPALAAAPTPAPALAAPRTATPASATPAAALRSAPAAPARPAGAPASPDTYEVKRGDNLGAIARQLKPASISLDQMLVALQRTNPDAFAGRNMNRLRAGQILSVPNEQAARGVGPQEARQIVVAQANDFNEYRNKLAGQVAGASNKPEPGAQIAGGKITAKVEDQANPANEARDRLKLSKSGVAPAADEDGIAQQKALAEANARIKELEQNLNDLQKLLELKNRGLAERQNQATGAEAVSPAATAPATAAASAPAAAQSAAPAGAPPAAKPAAPPVRPKAAAPAAVASEPGLMEGVLDNPLVLALGALVAALAGALGIRRFNQKKKEEELENSSLLAESALKTNSLFGSTGGQTVDTTNSMFNSSFSPSASQLDTNEVDPVAEADVYIAYGRDAQAEEILKEALRTQPERDAVRAKLLEIYANRKDAGTFEAMATELYGRTGGKGEEWQQAAALGVMLDPENPLYAGGKAIPAPAPAPADELDLDALLNTTRALGEDLESAVPAPREDLPQPIAAAHPVAASEPASQDAVPAAEAADNSLDFDFDLASLGISATPPATGEAEPASPQQSDPNLMDFDFDKLLAEAGGKAEAAPGASQPSLDDGLPELSLPEADDFADAAGTAAEPDAVAGAAVDTAAAAAELAAQEPETLEFDLSGLTLDLNPLGQEILASEPDVGNPSPAEPAAGNGQANFTEMATKLDLALAYREIGDQEGARELLDEVVKGGSPEQSEKARALLLELA